MLLNQYQFKNYFSFQSASIQGDFTRKLSASLKWVAVVMLSMLSTAIQAAVPAGFEETIVAQNIIAPTRMAIAPDGRVFIAEQAGRIRIVDQGKLLSQAFLNITTKVDSTGERGLLGIAFDPDFLSNQWVYVYYTSKSPVIHNRISRFTASGNVVVPGSEEIIFDIQALSTLKLHNGGSIQFGKDGKLYIAVGDNGTPSNAQTLTNLKGKVLRINKNGSIPTDNPFYQTATGINRAIWALGLRNPYTLGVQPGTGRIHINDVGQDAWEEVNRGVAGVNYGWPIVEGRSSNPAYRNPIVAYPHAGTGATGCAIIGGSFYNPVMEQFPNDYINDYFYGDFCSGWIRRYDIATFKTQAFASGIGSLVDIQVAPDGTLYYLERGGVLTKISWIGL
jgi:glucose/arabinose dehydrogenase